VQHATLLLVEDDPSTLSVLVEALKDQYNTLLATDAETALLLLKAQPPDLILLDLALPDLDGVLLITQIRQTSNVPIVVLTARTGQLDRVQSLRNGADDYILKPFDLDDLDSRISVVLKRAARPLESKEALRYYGTLSISERLGFQVDGISVHLTPLEYRLMTALIANGGDSVPRHDLIVAMWGEYDDSREPALDTLVARLRSILRHIEGTPELETIYGAIGGTHKREGFRLLI
jgi:two-component system, OmpR family, KDP operon response regulator KdpE